MMNLPESQGKSQADDQQPSHQEEVEDTRPTMESLTAEEKEAFLARARAQGRSLTSAEQYAIFGPPPEARPAPQAAVQVPTWTGKH
jgi:hypothetical protein